jgi:hypothetical protein
MNRLSIKVFAFDFIHKCFSMITNLNITHLNSCRRVLWEEIPNHMRNIGYFYFKIGFFDQKQAQSLCIYVVKKLHKESPLSAFFSKVVSTFKNKPNHCVSMLLKNYIRNPRYPLSSQKWFQRSKTSPITMYLCC